MDRDNRKSVNRIKMGIMGFMVLLFIVPMVISIYAVMRISELEDKLSEYMSQTTVSTVGDADIDYEQDLTQMDLEAKTSIETDTTSGNTLLSRNYEATANDAKDSTEADTEAATAEVTADETEALATETDAVTLNGKTIYLTFDDGPSQYTSEILDILDSYGIKATFFVVVDDYTYTEELMRIVEDGHTLGMHSASHDYGVIYENLDAFIEDVSTVHDIIYNATGVDSKYYRFPGGSSNTVADVSIDDCIDYLYSEGIEYFDWNALNGDAENLSFTADELNANVLGNIRSNGGDSMVLLHDLGTHYETVKALPSLIETLISEGYSFGAIDESTTGFHHHRAGEEATTEEEVEDTAEGEN